MASSRTKRGEAISLGRAQKYYPLPRHLYALLFPGNYCYVGQTVDLDRRKAEHRSERGGWMDPDFKMVHLGTITGTQAQAEDHEFAWRYKAYQAGWTIVGRPPRLVVDPVRRMTLRRRWIAFGLRWPSQHRLAWPTWLVAALTAGLAIGAAIVITSIGSGASL